MASFREPPSDESAWPLVRSWIAAASNDVRALPTERAQGERTAQLLGVTARSPLGAVALETGGLLADHGWLRVLGADEDGALGRGLATWNGLEHDEPPIEGALLVAHDAVGGFFAVNGGAFAGPSGNVFHFAPDTLDWLDLEMGYGDFLGWVCAGDLAGFYAGLRWPGWEPEVETAAPESGFHLFPPPFTAEGRPVEQASRRLVPMVELWTWYQELARRLAELPEGATFRIEPE